MPATVVETESLEAGSKPEILSDEQIELLLQEAESRLRHKTYPALDIADSDNTISLGGSDFSVPAKRKIPKLQHGLNESPYIREQNGVAKADPKLLVTQEQQKIGNELRPIPIAQGSKKVNDQTDAGPQWFNLPKTVLTPSLKRDLQLIEMRNVLDPHRHYKKNTRSKEQKIPTFSQVGTVIEGATEWYSGRLTRKERSKNFVEEAMRGERENGRFKRKYSEIQDTKTSGKKAHYKKLMEKRKKKG